LEAKAISPAPLPNGAAALRDIGSGQDGTIREPLAAALLAWLPRALGTTVVIDERFGTMRGK
jgi:hypothetical protein